MSVTEFQYWCLPGRCLLCGALSARDTDLCCNCEADLPWLGPACERCALPLPDHIAKCGRCRIDPPPFAATHSGFQYVWPVDRLINRFKHQGQLQAGRILSDLLARSIPDDFAYPDLLIPVPLHRNKRRHRGFNQSAEIALRLARAWSVPVDAAHCQRTKETLEQKTLSNADRLKNMKNAFVTEHRYAGERVAIVDDVVTTTVTVRELARTLLDAGVSSVQVISLARTPSK